MEPPAPRLEELTARLAVMLDEHHVAGAPAEELAKLIVEVIRQVVNAPVSFGVPTPAMIAALQAIAEPDELLEANEGAFGVHAARRMQAIARAALHRPGGGSAEGGTSELRVT